MSDPHDSNRAAPRTRGRADRRRGRPFGPYPSHRSLRILILAMVMIGAACTTDRGRPGSESPTEPARPDATEISGTYEAARILVERSGTTVDLAGDPDTRISLQLNEDGSAQGQLKIGADLQLRTKLALVGQWRLSVPDLVFFDFGDETFLEEIGFRVQLPALTGSWHGEDLRIDLQLRRVAPAGAPASARTARR